MKKILSLALVVAFVYTFAALYAQPGNAAKGKEVFDQCSVCHNNDSTEVKMGPGLKGMYKRKLVSTGQQATDMTVGAKIDVGGKGMPAYKDILAASEKTNVIAYLKTL